MGDEKTPDLDRKKHLRSCTTSSFSILNQDMKRVVGGPFAPETDCGQPDQFILIATDWNMSKLGFKVLPTTAPETTFTDLR